MILSLVLLSFEQGSKLMKIPLLNVQTNTDCHKPYMQLKIIADILFLLWFQLDCVGQ